MKSKVGFLISKVLRKIKKYHRRALARPDRIVIELTNHCNLNCPYCLVGQQDEQRSVAHSELTRSFGKMDMKLIEKIIKEAKSFGMSEVMLTLQGEPLLHEDFAEIVRKVKKAGLSPVVFTNGLLLNPGRSRDIIRAGLDSIRFSADGASEETYQLNRVGGKFEKVYQNMRDIACIAKEENSPIKIVWQFIALANNEHEIPKARGMAREMGIGFLVKSFAESIPELTARNPKYNRKLKPKPCTDIYQMFCIYWNGDVVPCCYDVSGKEILGNVINHTIEETWNSPKYQQFRKYVAQAVLYPKVEPQLCKTCLRWLSLDKINSNQEVKV